MYVVIFTPPESWSPTSKINPAPMVLSHFQKYKSIPCFFPIFGGIMSSLLLKGKKTSPG